MFVACLEKNNLALSGKNLAIHIIYIFIYFILYSFLILFSYIGFILIVPQER